MNQREKILLIVLLSAGGLWASKSLISGVLLAPINNRQTQITALRDSIDEKQAQADLILAAQEKLTAWKQQSLPPERLDAAALYENWLLKMAEEAKLTDIKVDRNPITPRKDTFAVIGMTVSAKGTMGQVADFLFAYQNADLLQKIRKIELTASENQGDPILDVTIVADAVSVNDTDDRDTLFEEGREQVVSKLMQDKTREQYAASTSPNIFVRGYNGPPPPKVEEKPTPQEPEKPGIDIAQHVYLVSSVTKGESRDVVLYNRTSNSPTKLHEGEEFDLAGIQGKVLSIGPDFLTMQIKDEIWRLELGQNLRQIEKIGVAEAKPADPSTASTE